MFIVQLAGGLGNQLFQFAYGRSLSMRYNQELKFDLRFLTKANQHSGYGLEQFCYEPMIASKDDLFYFPMIISSLAERMKNVINPILNVTTEVGLDYSEKYIREIHVKKHLYRGYWQTERYFKDFEEQIRKDLVFRYANEYDSLSIISEIKSCNSISIHIRRGDYIANPAAASIYYQCSEDYYSRAIDYIMERVSEPVFFVFSDDIHYAKLLFTRYGARFRYVDSTSSPYEDLYAMSCCQHNIIANSTFSWWGGWLNNHDGKINIFPREWFINPEMTHNIYPSNSIKV
ncbi:alpha-1,2-fucosyltransferase [Aeromonas veronii]|uniref:alpha-1,2-fucosyltransferase n=1 Tax=Aeromonas veronii TaxID=654 RepID=UPI003DA52504